MNWQDGGDIFHMLARLALAPLLKVIAMAKIIRRVDMY